VDTHYQAIVVHVVLYVDIPLGSLKQTENCVVSLNILLFMIRTE